MAKQLKSIKFPGLDDVYEIPTGGGTIDIDLEGAEPGTGDGTVVGGGSYTGPIDAVTLNGKTESELSVAKSVDSDRLGGKIESELSVAKAVDTDKLGGVAAAEYATVSGVNEQVKKAAPRNLLDNSYLKNPINQRGATSFDTSTSSSIKSLDRWRNARSTGSLDGNGLTLKWDGVNGTDGFIQQKIEGSFKEGDKFTFAAKVDGVIYSHIFTLGEHNVSSYMIMSNDIKFGCACSYYSETNSVLWVTLLTTNSTGIVIEWIAVYEGEYTAETLPEYQPKGYGAELLECQRYYYASSNYVAWPAYKSTTLYGFITLPTQMRVDSPTVTATITARGALDSEGATVSATIANVYHTSFGNVIRIALSDDGLSNNQVACMITRYLEISADL